jgi:hypothetical protein
MWRKCLLLGATAVAVGIAAFTWHRARGVVVPDDPDGVTLFSLDGRKQRSPLDRDKPTDKEFLYEFPVLGRVSITDPELQRRVITAVKQDLDSSRDERYFCFFPRHLLRVVKGGRTIDFLICFQCNDYQVYVDGKPAKGRTRSVGTDSEELLNKLLTDAGVPVAP